MVFGIVMLLLVVGVGYFHWVQGVLSGAISMGLAILAGTLAVGMHESVATAFLAGAMPDYADAIAMCGIFAVVYGVGRIAFDMLVPGNVRVPLYFDRVGGLVCGLIAGLFGVGTVATAAQTLPFGPSIVGFTRYPIAEEKQVTVQNPKNGRTVDAIVSGALDIEGEAHRPPPEKKVGLLLPVDQIVVDFAAGQSKGGALAGGRAFGDDHPDYLSEMFFGRAGIETGAKHIAYAGNVAGKNQVTFKAAFAPATLNQAEGEVGTIRNRTFKPLAGDPTKAGKIPLVIRVGVDRSASDTDQKFRFGTGSVRLVGPGGKEAYPIGTMYYPGNLVLANHVDDIQVADVSSGGTIDFVFDVDRDDVAGPPDADGRELKFKPGTYLEVKRYARVDLGDKTAAIGPPTPLGEKEQSVQRKKSLAEDLAKRISGQAK